mmetsp:Transcript_6156/g.15225  ORF Transcript_6156/g.15225 Transcript_6156/m.15225 type:complete len:84 (-) Transcript_6156:1536-1787(-)
MTPSSRTKTPKMMGGTLASNRKAVRSHRLFSTLCIFLLYAAPNRLLPSVIAFSGNALTTSIAGKSTMYIDIALVHQAAPTTLP